MLENSPCAWSKGHEGNGQHVPPSPTAELLWGQPLAQGSDGSSCTHPIAARAAASWESLTFRAPPWAELRDGIPDRDSASRALACHEWESSWPRRSGWIPCSGAAALQQTKGGQRRHHHFPASDCGFGHRALGVGVNLSRRARGVSSSAHRCPEALCCRFHAQSPLVSDAWGGRSGCTTLALPSKERPLIHAAARCCSEHNSTANCAASDPLCSQGNRRLCSSGILRFRGNSTT